jgi:hypothetical protein
MLALLACLPIYNGQSKTIQQKSLIMLTDSYIELSASKMVNMSRATFISSKPCAPDGQQLLPQTSHVSRKPDYGPSIA